MQGNSYKQASGSQTAVAGHVIIIDDDREIVDVISMTLRMEGYSVEVHSNAEAYLERLKFNQPEATGAVCVLCDINMPGLSGLELQDRLLQIDSTPLVLMSGASTTREAAKGFRAGAVDFLTKPFDADDLINCIAKALMLSAKNKAEATQNAAVIDLVKTLTKKERQVAVLAATGAAHQVIADTLYMALRTEKAHRERIREKLQISSDTDLVRIVDKFMRT
jgi:FixJ family two-component response regulator